MHDSRLAEPRKPGRPPGARSAQRGRLLQAARDLLVDAPEDDLALRRVAQRAGVTAALAHYYFANRDGLFDALIQERATPRIDDLLNATRVRAAQPVNALTFLMQRLTSLAATDAFLSRCLLSPRGRVLRERILALGRELLQAAQTQGMLRADLPLDYLGDALLGLCLFPFLDAPPNERGAERAATLPLHHVALLQDGIVQVHRPRQDSVS
jgi:TetR/AcrR family transcriptional regulator